MKLHEIYEGTRCWKGYKKKGTKMMFGKRVPNCVKNEGEVVDINPHAVKPYFSPEEAQRANDEWVNQAQVDQQDGVIVKGTDGKQYRIMTSYGNQHFEDGEVFLQGLTDPNYIDTDGYPDAAELLYYHSATGHYPDDEGKLQENQQSRTFQFNWQPDPKKDAEENFDDWYNLKLKNDPNWNYNRSNSRKIFRDLYKILLPQEMEENFADDEGKLQENQQLPQEVQSFVNSLTPDDVGVDTVGKYIVHYEGFTDQCNDGHDEKSIDGVYADVYKDFDQRQGIPALLRGVANDDLGCDNNPVLYSVYKNTNENYKSQDVTKQGRNLSPLVKKYLKGKNTKLTKVKVADLDMDTPGFDRIIGDLGDVNFADTTDPIVVDADGKTILDGFHRVQKAKDIGKEVIPAYMVIENLKAKLLPENIQRGDCFEAAIKQMLEYAKENPAMLNSLSLVHGYVTGQGSYVKDQRYGHGWLEIGDVVHDCTKNAIMRKEQYYKLGNINPNELKKYSYKDVLQKISATKHYGPWDLQKTEFEKGMEEFDENFADGKKKGKSRPGRVKRSGASCKGSVTSLRKKAKNSSGEKSKMYHWCANMKSGRKKK